MDQLQSAELAETGHSVSFTCNIFKIDDNSIAGLGLQPNDLTDILSQPELTMEIYDAVSDTVRYSISGVKFAGGSGSVDARGVWQGTWNFEGLIGRGL